MRVSSIRNSIPIPLYWEQNVDPLVDLNKEPLQLCLWHDDHHPSMRYDKHKQILKCWACGAGGDVIEIHRLVKHFATRDEAIKSLLEMYTVHETVINKAVIDRELAITKEDIEVKTLMYKVLSLVEYKKDPLLYCKLDQLMSMDLAPFERVIKLKKFYEEIRKR